MRVPSFLLAPLLLVDCAAPRGAPPSPVLPVLPGLPGQQSFEDRAPLEGFRDPDRRSKLAASFPKLDALLAEKLAAHTAQGVVLGVVIDGELAYQKGVGVADRQTKAPVDADTVFRIGSITKTFTSLAILKLRDAGKLALDEPAVRYLPELATVKYPTHDSAPITIRHLLTHSSGLPAVGNFVYAQSDHDVTTDEMFKGISGLSLEAPPGARYKYSNLGMALVGLIVERASGVRYRDFVTNEIFTPLAMRASRWDQGAVPKERLATGYARGADGPQKMEHWRLGQSEAAGGIYTSLHDLVRYAAFQLAAYPPRNDRDSGPVRRSSVREAHALQRSSELSVAMRDNPKPGEPVVEAMATGIGLAWLVYQACEFEHVVEHAGATEGYASAMLFLPRRGVAIVALANQQEAAAWEVVRQALDILNASGGLSLRTVASDPTLSTVMTKVLDLYNDFTEPRYRQLLTDSFQAALPFAQGASFTQGLKSVHGACKNPEPREIKDALSGRFSVSCERGRIEFDITATPDGKLRTAMAESRDIPLSPSLQKAATLIADLIDRWNHATYADLLAPAFAEAAMQTFFHQLGTTHRSCVPGQPLDGDGDGDGDVQKTASVALSCEQGGDLKLDFALGARSRVTMMRIVPLVARSSATCPLR